VKFWRPPIVYLADHPSGRLLPWVIAVMAYLAALGLAGVITLDQSVANWRVALSHTVTVQITGSDEATREKERDAVVGLLKTTPGIESALPMSKSEVRNLLEPYLGAGNVTDDLPIPLLIDVSLSRDHAVDFDALRKSIKEVAPDAELDDHGTWLQRFISLAENIQFIAGGIVTLVGFATVAIVIFATRAGMAIHHDTIEILHLIGAKDSFIAAQFQRHFVWLGFKGGLIGLVVALLSLLGISRLSFGMEDAFIPKLTFSATLLVALVLLPVIASLLTMVTARQTVKSTLSRMI
jgi:cell division transport system permease protein